MCSFEIASVPDRGVIAAVARPVASLSLPHCCFPDGASEPVVASADRSFTARDVIQEIHREPWLLAEMERLAGGRLTECSGLPVKL